MAKRRDVDDTLVRADELLYRIGHAKRAVAALEADYNAAVERLKADYGPQLSGIRDEIGAYEKELYALMKAAKGRLFDGRDIVRLPNGSLLRQIAERVTIPRDALARCEEMGFSEAIRIVKSLARDVVEKWPDARLALIGARRKIVEDFSYDVED